MKLTAKQAARLDRLKQLGYIATYTATTLRARGDRVIITTSGGDSADIAPREIDPYCSGLAHGAWAARVAAGDLPEQTRA